jgi:hypothetical protein
MYAKPPGLEAALARDKEQEDKARQVGRQWLAAAAGGCWGLLGACWGPPVLQMAAGGGCRGLEQPRHQLCSSVTAQAAPLPPGRRCECRPGAPAPPAPHALLPALPLCPQEQLKLEAAKQAEAGAGALVAGGGGGAAGAAAAPDPREQRQQHKLELDRVREDPYAAMLAARMALQKDSRWGLCGSTAARQQRQR